MSNLEWFLYGSVVVLFVASFFWVTYVSIINDYFFLEVKKITKRTLNVSIPSFFSSVSEEINLSDDSRDRQEKRLDSWSFPEFDNLGNPEKISVFKYFYINSQIMRSIVIGMSRLPLVLFAIATIQKYDSEFLVNLFDYKFLHFLNFMYVIFMLLWLTKTPDVEFGSATSRKVAYNLVRKPRNVEFVILFLIAIVLMVLSIL